MLLLLMLMMLLMMMLLVVSLLVRIVFALSLEVAATSTSTITATLHLSSLGEGVASAPVFQLLLDRHSVVLILSHYLLQSLPQESVDHGVIAIQILIGVLAPALLQ